MRIFESDSMGSKPVGMLVEVGLYTKFRLYVGGHFCNYSVTQSTLSKAQNARTKIAFYFPCSLP